MKQAFRAISEPAFRSALHSETLCSADCRFCANISLLCNFIIQCLVVEIFIVSNNHMAISLSPPYSLQVSRKSPSHHDPDREHLLRIGEVVQEKLLGESWIQEVVNNNRDSHTLVTFF